MSLDQKSITGNSFLSSSLSLELKVFYAFEKLLKNNEYKYVRIKDICTEAHISKPTFYRYFRNKDDIVLWLTKEALRSGIAQVGRDFSWLEGNHYSAAVFYYYRGLYHKVQHETRIFILVSTCSKYLSRELLETLADRNAMVDGIIRFQIDSICMSLCYQMLRWLLEKSSIEPKEFAKYLTSTVPADLLLLMNRR